MEEKKRELNHSIRITTCVLTFIENAVKYSEEDNPTWFLFVSESSVHSLKLVSFEAL